MATATLNTSDQYVKLLVTTSCSLSGNYPNIKVNTQGQYILQFQVQVRGKQRKLLMEQLWIYL